MKSEQNTKKEVPVTNAICLSSDDDSVTGKPLHKIFKDQPLQLDLNEITVQPEEQLLFLGEPGYHSSSESSLYDMFETFFGRGVFQVLAAHVNDALAEQIRRDHMTITEKEVKAMLAKKKFSDVEIKQFLGMGVLFGLMRFPKIDCYHQAEPILLGGVETCMQEGRFKFIETQLNQPLGENEQQRLLGLLSEIRRKWRKIYNPDQELFLVGVKRKNHKAYYLMDAETLFIEDMTIIQSETKNFQEMLANFQRNNHILYFQTDTLDFKMISTFAEHKIFCCGEITEESLTQSQDQESKVFYAQLLRVGKFYSNGKLNFIRSDDKVFIFPSKWMKSEQTDTYLYYSERLKQLTSKAEENIKLIDKYRNPYTLACKSIDILHRDMAQVMLSEYFEVSIYNMYCVLNTIIINGQSMRYMEFRIKAAAFMIGDRYTALERDKKILNKKMTTILIDGTCQTEKLSFGLLDTYPTSKYHLPLQNPRSQQVKYCVVCMQFENITKSFFECQVCSQIMKQRVFICTTPCFEIFHKQPTQFLEHIDYKLIESFRDDKYFRREIVFAQPNLRVPERDLLGQYQTRIPKTQDEIYLEQEQRFKERERKNEISARSQRSQNQSRHHNSYFNDNQSMKQNPFLDKGIRRKTNNDAPIEKCIADVINSNPQLNRILSKPARPRNSKNEEDDVQFVGQGSSDQSIMNKLEGKLTGKYSKFYSPFRYPVTQVSQKQLGQQEGDNNPRQKKESSAIIDLEHEELTKKEKRAQKMASKNNVTYYQFYNQQNFSIYLAKNKFTQYFFLQIFLLIFCLVPVKGFAAFLNFFNLT